MDARLVRIFFGDSYIDPVKIGQALLQTTDFATALYNLQISERSARTTGYKAYDYILSLCQEQEYVKQHRIGHPNTLIEAFDVVRNKYGDLSLTQLEICEAYDNAKLNVVLNRPPTHNNDLEAMFTYDLVVLLRAQNNRNQDQLQTIDDYTMDSTKAAMKRAMLVAYESEGSMFAPIDSNQRLGNYVFANDMFELCDCNTMFLSQMSELEQVRNPHLIAYTIMLEGEKAVDCVKNIDAFKLWYYSDLNDFHYSTQESLSNILGEDYAPEFAAAMNDQLNRRLTQEVESRQATQLPNIGCDEYSFGKNDNGLFDTQNFDDRER